MQSRAPDGRAWEVHRRLRWPRWRRLGAWGDDDDPDSFDVDDWINASSPADELFAPSVALLVAAVVVAALIALFPPLFVFVFEAIASSSRLSRSSPSRFGRRGGSELETLVERLAAARIGDTFNQYHDERLTQRLARYLDERTNAPLLLVGEAAGYRGARVSGIAFTSERQLSGIGPAEATATIVHRVLAELDVEDDVLLWNVVPTHPGTPHSNRSPTRAEIEAGLSFALELARGRRVLAVGRIAEAALGAPYVRHPSHGGAAAFRETLRACLT